MVKTSPTPLYNAITEWMKKPNCLKDFLANEQQDNIYKEMLPICYEIFRRYYPEEKARQTAEQFAKTFSYGKE